MPANAAPSSSSPVAPSLGYLFTDYTSPYSPNPLSTMASLKSDSCVTVCNPDDASLYEKASGLEAIGQPAALPTPYPSPTLAPADRGFAAWATVSHITHCVHGRSIELCYSLLHRA